MPRVSAVCSIRWFAGRHRYGTSVPTSSQDIPCRDSLKVCAYCLESRLGANAELLEANSSRPMSVIAIYQRLSGAGQVNYRFQLAFGRPRDGAHANQGGSFSLGSRPAAKNSPSLVRLTSSFSRSFKCISFNSLFALFAEIYNPTIVPSPELSR